MARNFKSGVNLHCLHGLIFKHFSLSRAVVEFLHYAQRDNGQARCLKEEQWQRKESRKLVHELGPGFLSFVTSYGE